jgi:hypothetical protein
MIVFEQVSAEIAPSSTAQAAQAGQVGQMGQMGQGAPLAEASQASPSDPRALEQVRHALALLAERRARLQAD